jgi:hypothetical protein
MAITGTDAQKIAAGDFNFDGMVDAFDLNVLAANWGRSESGLQVILTDGGGSPASSRAAAAAPWRTTATTPTATRSPAVTAARAWATLG